MDVPFFEVACRIVMLMDEGCDGRLVDPKAEQFASFDVDAEIISEGEGAVGAALERLADDVIIYGGIIVLAGNASKIIQRSQQLVERAHDVVQFRNGQKVGNGTSHRRILGLEVASHRPQMECDCD